MTTESAPESTFAEAIPSSESSPDSKQSRAAIKRCCAAWQRAHDAYLEGKEESSIKRAYAVILAGPAYCKAMPPLAGYENIRDFIACATHGILINAIPEKRANQLLYAAQVALASLNHAPKPQKSA
jgi:hypothetical protein